MTTDDASTEAAVVAELAERAQEFRYLDGGVLGVVLPADHVLHIENLERFDEVPARKRGHANLHDARSLGAYVKAHNGGDFTSLYADIDTSSITAVLDGHSCESEVAGWAEHQATLRLRQTPNWRAWVASDGAWVEQHTFAEHIEENLIDIIDPTGAAMLELAQNFQATNRVQFKTSQLLASGQRQFIYEETVESRAGEKGQITVPSSFTIGLAVYEGQTEGHRVPVRLQFRINSGDLRLRYLLERPQDVIKSAFDNVVAEIEKDTGYTAFRGSMPS